MSFAAVLERLQKLENPYPGLRPFERHEQHLFFGRDQQIRELVERLERNRFVAVVGVSGSGKSSLVRAGLIPALERGSMGEAGARWRIVITRPAGSPFASLSADLLNSGLDPSSLRQSSHGLIQVARQLPSGETLLVVVDQFEELFRYKDRAAITEEARRERETAASEASEFVQLLLAASQQQPAIYIVLTMRSDYLGDCAEFRDLPETFNDCQYLVPRLTREQRKAAIEGPLGGVRIAPSLVQRILNDAGDDPDQLPILQHALMRTWSHWRRSDPEQKRRIEVEDYETVGGFQNALNQHPDELLQDVPVEMTATIFKRLTARGLGDRERRDPATFAELCAICGADTAEQQSHVTAVIDHFRRGEATFLTPREEELLLHTYIDVTHESLIRQWAKLRDEWLPQESKSAKTLLDLVERAANWKAGRGELLVGLDLSEAATWNRERNQTTTWTNHYANESALGNVVEFITASQAQEQGRIFRAKRNLWIAIALALLFAALAGTALYESNRAVKLETIALVRQLAAQSELLQTGSQPDLEPAGLVATEAMERFPSFEADRSLREPLKMLSRQVEVFTHQDSVYAVAFSADGRYVATGSLDKTARVFEAASGKELARLEHQDGVNAVAFSPDGRYVATGSLDKTARVFETAGGKEVARLMHQDRVNAVAFSPDGRHVATGSGDKTTRVFEVASGKEVAHLTHQDSVNAVAFSPDGRYVATASGDKTARVFEVASGKELARLTHQDGVDAVAYSPDGRYVATGSRDKTARVFEVASGKEVARLTHQDHVDAVAFSPDGLYVATGSWDKTAWVFEAASGKVVAGLTHQDRVDAVAFSPDGLYVATGSWDKTAWVFEAASGKKVALLAHPDSVYAVAFSPDGHVATGSADKTARVFEAVSGREAVRPTHPDSVDVVALSPNGRYVATGSRDNTAQVFEVASGKEVARLAHQDYVDAVAFSPDGRHVATGSADKTARVFEVGSGKEVARLAHQDYVDAVAFSPDGRRVATGSADKTARVFEVDSGKEVARLTHQDSVNAVAFSPDGRFVTTGSADKTARIFEVANGKAVSQIVLTDRVVAVTYTSEGRYLMTAALNSTEVIMSKHLLLPHDLIADACSRFARNLTPDEWREYVGAEIPYHKTCPNLH